MKKKVHQTILVNIILITSFFVYFNYLFRLPPCENNITLLIKAIPLIIILIVTIIYNLVMQKKVNIEVNQEVLKEAENVRQNLENRKNL